jgi:predicted AlkP superfamily phosphohydrolase/phosphomutase
MSVFRDYYRMLDAQLGCLFEDLPDDVAVLVVSDHGAQAMLGGFCINEWLRQRGLLVLLEDPAGPTPIAKAKVDWRRTIAWADGGYYARVFLNVAGREPAGRIVPSEYEAVRDELIREIESITGPEGRPMANRAFRPEEIYPEVNAVAPDLVVYLDDLRWRSVGSLGVGDGLYTFDNDTGPDDANHSEYGVFAMRAKGISAGRVDTLSVYDVTPTLRSVMGLAPDPHTTGRAWA